MKSHHPAIKSVSFTASFCICPACNSAKMPNSKGENSSSRYAKGIYICADCGIKEAFEGFFWEERYLMFGSVYRARQTSMKD